MQLSELERAIPIYNRTKENYHAIDLLLQHKDALDLEVDHVVQLHSKDSHVKCESLTAGQIVSIIDSLVDYYELKNVELNRGEGMAGLVINECKPYFTKSYHSENYRAKIFEDDKFIFIIRITSV